MPIVINLSSVNDAIAAFAKVDVLHSHLARTWGISAGLEPTDDAYHAPYSFVTCMTRKSKNADKQQRRYVIVTGHATGAAHDAAILAMGTFGAGVLAVDRDFVERHTHKDVHAFR
jgi:hypothetical protein